MSSTLAHSRRTITSYRPLPAQKSACAAEATNWIDVSDTAGDLALSFGVRYAVVAVRLVTVHRLRISGCAMAHTFPWLLEVHCVRTVKGRRRCANSGRPWSSTSKVRLTTRGGGPMALSRIPTAM